MKRGVIYFVFFLILIISLYNIEQKYVHKKGMEKVTSESMIDSMASVSVSILVDLDPPIVIVDSPENKSYSSGSNIPLNYIVTDISGVDSIWYNLDNGENTTITNNITFNINDGSHTLYLFANDAHGFLNDSEFVSFIIGNPFCDETDDDNDGEVEFDDEIIKESVNKITNLPSGCTVNVTFYNRTLPSECEAPSITLVESVFNYLEINVNEPTSNGNYIIYFNLSSSELGSNSINDVRLFVYENSNWEELATSVIDSSSDPKSFSAITTHFSSFLIGVKASITPPPTGGAVSGGGSAGAGGGGGAVSDFSIDQEFLKISVKKNELLKKRIKVTNTGSSLLDLIIDLQELKKVISISDKSFKLKTGEEKVIDLNLLTGVGVAPGVYVGSILIKAGEQITKLIKMIIEIESEKVLFDISLNVPLDYKTVNPGNEFVVQSTLINMGGLSNVNINIEYNIENSKGEIVLKDQEDVVVGSQASFTKKFLIPKDLPLGEYVITAVVKYEDSVGTSSETFIVGKKEKFFNIFNISVISGVLIILILMILWERMGLKNIEKLQKERLGKLGKKKGEINSEDVKNKLKKELDLLEKSYKSGYITKSVYDKSMERVKNF